MRCYSPFPFQNVCEWRLSSQFEQFCQNLIPGKGGFWKLDPVCEDKLRKGEKFYRLRKRRVKKARANVEHEVTISSDGQECMEAVGMGTPSTVGSLEPLPEALVPTEFEICQEWTLDWDGERVFELDLVDWNLIL